MEDKRFAHVSTDPKFRNIRRDDQKVKIDKRFQSMFKDKKFKVKYSVDKRGRIVNQTSSADLRRYYHLSSEESSSDDESNTEDDSNNEDESNNEEKEAIEDEEPTGKFVKAPESDSDESDKLESGDKTDNKVSEAVKKKLKNLSVDYARGESNLFSESSSDEEDTEDDIDEEADQIEHKWGELDADADRTEEATYRLAVCNLDWDRIRASDLIVLFNSFVPQGGLIKSIAIYPSEFGKQRMKDEELKGPIELVENKLEVDNDEENEDGAKYHMEKLRQYQLNRLKYYYAVVECDSATTANKIYTECDGMEYESSATKVDLRFVPDDMTFDDAPKEICDKLPDLSKYQPRFFTNSALQQAKVDLTWDETNPERIEITQKLAAGNVDDITETELQNYLASSSGEESAKEEEKSDSEDENEGDPIDKYRALLSEIETKEKNKDNDVQLEISWGVDLQEKTDKLIKKKQEDKIEKTPFQQYLDKRKEKRKEKREQRRNKQSEGDSDDSDIPEGIDMNDPYFAEEFDKPEFKKKPKKTKQQSESEDDEQNQAELELLLMNEDDSKKHFSLKKIQDLESESKSKKKKNKNVTEKADDFEINVEDDRFSALYTSHHFNIDPTDSHFKKTKAMEKIISEKLKRRNDDDDTTISKKPKTQKHKNAELNVLVKSVKRKTEALANKKSK